MKLNKSRNKGKVHPSSSSPTFYVSSQNDPVSSLNTLLPTAILTLISILSLQDKEVLAYMLTQYSSSSSSSSSPHSKKTHHSNNKVKTTHKIPTFDCGCFDCYTSYWFRWDSSSHRELIHHAIEAFEEHLSSSELKHHRKNTSSKGKRKEKGKKSEEKAPSLNLSDRDASEEVLDEVVEVKDSALPENLEAVTPEKEESPVVGEECGAHMQIQQQHKGLARKVLPDVIGLFNSRLWNLWGPNV